jgi:hypothetical protein
MKFTYEATLGESCNIFSIYFSTVEEGLLMLKTMRKHFKDSSVSCTWKIKEETFTA